MKRVSLVVIFAATLAAAVALAATVSSGSGSVAIPDGTPIVQSFDTLTNSGTMPSNVLPAGRRRSRRERLWEILDVSLNDRRQAWHMYSDGNYTQLRPQTPDDGPASLGTHQTLIDLTKLRLGQFALTLGTFRNGSRIHTSELWTPDG